VLTYVVVRLSLGNFHNFFIRFQAVILTRWVVWRH